MYCCWFYTIKRVYLIKSVRDDNILLMKGQDIIYGKNITQEEFYYYMDISSFAESYISIWIEMSFYIFDIYFILLQKLLLK